MTPPLDSCLCVTEKQPGRQDVGRHTASGFVKDGTTVCQVCMGTAESPRHRGASAKAKP